MSELIQEKTSRASLRWRLFAGVSVLALAAHIASAEMAMAEDADRPTVWIDLGGQLSHLQDGQETFAPSVMDARPSIFDPSQKFEKPPSYSFDGYGEISVRPEHSDWVFGATIQYGRSKSRKYKLQQTNPEPFKKYYSGYTNTANPVAQRFAETTTNNSEQHVILDFKVGRDVGLGLFGNNATSVVSAGVRFAQFGSKTNISLKSDPDWHFNYKYLASRGFSISNGQDFHSNLARMTAENSFHGMGPSISWKASAPLAGDQNESIAIDWGLNAAVLFGRQKARTHHQTTARYFSKYGPLLTQPVVPHTISPFPVAHDHTRFRSVTVPNIGGFAGLSFNYSNAKLSFGYRADFFFGAMDGGIDARKTYDRSFYGPFATVSIGLGG